MSSLHVDQVQGLKKIKHEKKDETIDDIDEQSRGQDVSGLDREFVIQDSILTDDFFGVLDELDVPVLDSVFYGFYSQE